MSRHDIYRRSHKALRALMAETLVAVGRIDFDDECEVRDGQARIDEMLAFCDAHAALENEFVHRAIEARRAEASCRFAHDHDALEARAESLRAHAAARSPQLHRHVAAFVAESFLHMEDEEEAGNALLWSLFTDAEIMAIERRLVAARPPEQAMQSLRWMLPSVNHAERVALLDGLRNAPAAVRQGALAVAQSHLPAHDFARLEKALPA